MTAPDFIEHDHPRDAQAVVHRPPSAPFPIAFAARLRAELPLIDVEGWDGPVATALLNDILRDLVAPVLTEHRLTGALRDQAQATAWEELWFVLRGDRIRMAANPWRVLNAVARRAVLGELVAASQLTSPRKAWPRTRQADVTAGAGGCESSGEPPSRLRAVHSSLDVLLEFDFDLVDPTVPGGVADLGRRLALVADAMVATGWSRLLAVQVLEGLAFTARDARRGRPGWRLVADRLELPQWSVRRVHALVCGTSLRPGLLERLVHDGVEALAAPDIVAALASTLDDDLPSPAPAMRAQPSQVDDAGPRTAERRAS